MRIRTIDIGEWGSPVAEQYGIEKLPTVWYYQGSKLVDDDYARILRDHGK